ncbi:MAG: AI-2E family transporter [Acidobacteriota bacterium]
MRLSTNAEALEPKVSGPEVLEPPVPDPLPAPPAPEPRNTPLMILAGLAVVGALWLGGPILIPLVFGGLLSYALDPLHRRIINWGAHPAVSATLMLTMVIGVVSLGGYALRYQAAGFMDQLPVATERIHAMMRQLGGGTRSPMGQVQQAAVELRKAADEAAPAPARGVTRVQVEDPPMRMGDLLWRAGAGAIGIVEQTTIVLFLVFYLLASGDLYKRKIVKIAGPSLSKKRVTIEILNEITKQIERFLVARLIVSLIVGVVGGLAFWALGVSEPAMWGLGAGVLNTVPYVGPSVLSLAAAVAGLLQFGTASMGFVLGAVSLAIAAVEGSFVTPWLMGRAGRMNAGAVFIGLSFWGWIWGVWGLLLAVPILMVTKAVCDHIEGWSPVSELLGE